MIVQYKEALVLALLILVVMVVSLRKEKIHSREEYYGIDHPIALQGRIDQVSWVKGHLRVEELKTRLHNTVYQSDVWQLSLYKFLLRHAQNKKVSEEGVVYIKTSQSVFTHHVTLKTDKEVINYFHRYLKIKFKKTIGNKINNKNFCNRCSHKSRCN